MMGFDEQFESLEQNDDALFYIILLQIPVLNKGGNNLQVKSEFPVWDENNGNINF